MTNCTQAQHILCSHSINELDLAVPGSGSRASSVNAPDTRQKPEQFLGDVCTLAVGVKKKNRNGGVKFVWTLQSGMSAAGNVHSHPEMTTQPQCYSKNNKNKNEDFDHDGCRIYMRQSCLRSTPAFYRVEQKPPIASDCAATRRKLTPFTAVPINFAGRTF